MNFGTKLRTVLTIATCLNTALIATDLSGFQSPTVDAIYKIVSIAVNFVVVFSAAYFNNDFSEVEAKYTGMMRQEKAEAKQDYVGENFSDETEFSELFEEDEDEQDV